MKTYSVSTAASATRATKDVVKVTVHMTDGTVFAGDLYVLKSGQRLQDLLNDNARQFLPLRTTGGVLTFINRDFMKTIAEHNGEAPQAN